MKKPKTTQGISTRVKTLVWSIKANKITLIVLKVIQSIPSLLYYEVFFRSLRRTTEPKMPEVTQIILETVVSVVPNP